MPLERDTVSPAAETVKLNAALHTVAITQMRTPRSLCYAYYTANIAQGKTAREARRCLKRRLADHIWRTMITATPWRRTREDARGRLCMHGQRNCAVSRADQAAAAPRADDHPR